MGARRNSKTPQGLQSCKTYDGRRLSKHHTEQRVSQAASRQPRRLERHETFEPEIKNALGAKDHAYNGYRHRLQKSREDEQLST